MTRWMLSLELIDSPLVWVFAALTVVVALVIVAARPRRVRRLLITFAAATVAAYAAAHVLAGWGIFDGALPVHAALWAAAGTGFIVIGFFALFLRPWWRRALGILLVILAATTAGLGVNASYGLTHNLAAILGVQALDSAPLPNAGAASTDPSTLYETWTPPAGMPAQGRVSALSGDQRIPSTGFSARDAAVYLPPAALVADPPQLPLIVFMMGQPGSPDPTALAAALDAFAAAHNGLAPIAIVADQLGSVNADPACADSKTYGTVSTYINQDVLDYATRTLNIVDDPAYRVIGGYSNGGSCAFTYGAQHPELWGNVMDISGNEYPGSEHIDQTIADAFGGDSAAFTAAKPAAQLAAHPGAYDGHVAVFTHGDQDATFGPGQVSNAALAQQAGFTVYAETIAGEGHVGAALSKGLTSAIDALGPRLGLAAPTG
ncbi:alpha/beta hydrolase-fold protein [Microbacterium sp. cx-59]|uniref:alpha/beta hydrolase-fold protein n=1 Tax=Microbacterium sp. cx-59 TaxID=2891207 RepID=UPI001E4DCABF|nr:alpha/beta hydrolase-fold protein [Microbacterium sp. cx-59]MCC4909601.1 esterase [Microbacterium sp. cx-59]